MYKHLYSRFLKSHADEIHFAGHSHHYWPDVTREAQLQYWDDSCTHVDDKWSFLFSQKIPLAQKLICENLNLSAPSQIVFAPNTHELAFRLLSSLPWNKPVKILTTDSEFYSFDRQVNRLSELAQFEIVKVPTMPFETFEERFINEMKKHSWDLIFFSHVFFNSGVVADIHRIVSHAPTDSLLAIDGYHAFMAVPTDLRSIEDRVFYIAGSYKYAQGGEGCCFMSVPSRAQHRPLNTGWFAEIGHLSKVEGKAVGYPTDALQYAGSTMDFSALYRLIAVLELFKKESLSVSAIHGYVQTLQSEFISSIKSDVLKTENILQRDLRHHGHFLTFKMPSTASTEQMVENLRSKKIKVDSRGDRLRFGFGLYLDKNDIHSTIARL
jgi:selenocysteine lyase/cysteine desulfurase